MNYKAMSRYKQRVSLLFGILLFSILLTGTGTIYGQTVQLVDASKNPVTEYYLSNPNNEIYVLVQGAAETAATTEVIINIDIMPAPNVDIETVTLDEQLPDNGGEYFGPTGGLTISFDVPTVENGAAEARAGQQVVANYAGSLQSTAFNVRKHLTASTTSLLDSSDAAKTYYFIATENIYFEVTDENRNGQPDTPDTVNLVATTDGGDSETITLTETGDDTGIFKGSITSALGTITTGNGVIEADNNHILTATYTDADDGADITADTAHFIRITPSTTTLTNGAGTEHDPYLINSEQIFITVSDSDKNLDHTVQETIEATLTDGITGDTITLTLSETTNNSGIFRNITGIQSQIGSSTVDGIIQTADASVIQADYTDADDGSDSSSDIAVMAITPSVSTSRFTDNSGNDVGWYTIGNDDIYVTVNESDKNVDTSVQTITADLSSSTGDLETITLTETGGNTGVFRNTSAMSSTKTTPGLPANNNLEVWVNENITITYTDPDDATDVSSDLAGMLYGTNSVTTITNQFGIVPSPDEFTVSIEDLYITVTDDDRNENSSVAETITATFTVDTTLDIETITLTETGVNTGIFRNTTGMFSVILGGTAENGIIEVTANAIVTAQYTDVNDATDISSDNTTMKADETASVVEFTNAAATTVTSYQIGADLIFVELDDPDQNMDAELAETLDVTLSSFGTGDVETLQLTETGLNTGLFFNTVGFPLALEADNDQNGTLGVTDSSIIRTLYQDPDDVTDSSTDNVNVRVAQTASATQCTDSTGVSILFHQINDKFYVTVDDQDENTNPSTAQTVICTVTNQDNFDNELITLTETGVNTGIFRNNSPVDGLTTSIQAGAVTTGDNNLEANDNNSILAEYRDNDDATDYSSSNCTFQYKSNSQIILTDITGGATILSYTIGAISDGIDPVYIQVTDYDENHDPLVQEVVFAELSDLRTGGDIFRWSNYPSMDGQPNAIELTETTSSSGIFRSTTGLESIIDSVDMFDDELQTIHNATIRANYTDPDDPTDTSQSNTAIMVIEQTFSIMWFADSFGNSLSDYPISTTVASDKVYIVVEDDDQNYNADIADTLVVSMTSILTSDSDQFTLTEVDFDAVSLTGIQNTSDNSGIFMFGPIDANTDFRILNDGILQTSVGTDVVKCHYQDPDFAGDYDDVEASMFSSDDFAGVISFTDSAGVDVTTYVIETDLVFATLIDPDENRNGSIQESVLVTFTSDLGDEISWAALVETTSASGVFRTVDGIAMAFSAPGDENPGNITLECEVGIDNLQVWWEDAAHPSGVSSDVASTIKEVTTGTVLFTDAAGITQNNFTVGVGDIYITVWNSGENQDAGLAETIDVDIVSPITGDFETIDLDETGLNTGIFRNNGDVVSIDGLDSDIDTVAADGTLQVSVGETIIVTYVSSVAPFDISTDSAVMDFTPTPWTAFEFIDSAPSGVTTDTYFIGQDLIFVHLDDLDRNQSAITTDTVNITLTDSSTGDTLTVLLSEISQNDSIFENWTTGVPSIVGIATADNILQTSHLSEIYIDYQDPDTPTEPAATSTATMYIFEDFSEIAFTNQAGTTVTSFWISPLTMPSLGNNELIYITIFDADENKSASVSETIICTITDGITDDVISSIVLTETGDNTGYFRNITGIDSEIATSNPADMILQTAGTAEIVVEYTDVDDPFDYNSTTADMMIRPANSFFAQFTDDAGISQASYYINADLIYVTVRDPDRNANAMEIETFEVDITTDLTGDYETMILTELTTNSEYFRNIVGLPSVVGAAVISDYILQTQASDIVTVDYVDPDDPTDTQTDTATMLRLPTVSTVSFIVSTSVPPAISAASHSISTDLILVEVYDPDQNIDPNIIESVFVTISSPESMDTELLECYETGVNTGYFQVPTSDGIYSLIALSSALTANNGAFETAYPSDLTVTYIDPNDLSDQATHTIPTSMFTSTSTIWFSEADGTPTTSFNIYEDLIYLTLYDEDQNTDASSAQSVITTIYDPVTADNVELTLFETSDNSSEFRNYLSGIESIVSTATTSNVILETGADNFVSVIYQDPTSATEIATDQTVMLMPPSTSVCRFTDVSGTTAAYYMIFWDFIYGEVTDRDQNRSATVSETVTATFENQLTGDIESLVFTETTSSSGIFRSTSLPSDVVTVLVGDGILSCADQSDTELLYIDSIDPSDESTSAARMFIASSNSSISFFGESFASGYYFGTDEMFVRVIDPDENINPDTDDSLVVTLYCTASGDIENLLLLEDGGSTSNSSDFFNDVGFPTIIATTATAGNGIFEAPHNGIILAAYSDPDNPPTTPPLDYSWTTAEARIPATTSDIIFSTALGGGVISYLAGKKNIYVTLTDFDQNTDPAAIENLSVTIDTGTPIFDSLTFTVTEIGINAGVFRNTIPIESEIAVAAVADSKLQIEEEGAGLGYDNVEVTYIDPDDGLDQALHDIDITYRTDSVIAFTDSAGTTSTTYTIGVDDIYVTIWDEDNNLDVSAIETIPVTVVANYNNDTEYLLLHETGVDTGIFRNIVRLGSTYAMDPTSGDNVVQTIANALAPEEFITVDYIDPGDAVDSNSTNADMIPADRDDRDGDGIPNSFEDAYPGVLDSDDPGDAGQDFDGDGRINILEYQQGTDPNDPADNMPVANAGAYQMVDPSIVQLDGAASYDPSTHVPTGLVSYQWTSITVPNNDLGVPAIVSFDDPNIVNPRFIARTAGTYEFELSVRDADGVVNTGYVDVDVNDVDPMAEIIISSTMDGADYAGFTMDARGSTDANGEILVFAWGSTSLPAPPALVDNTLATPAFSSTPAAGVYEMDCDIIDPGANSDFGTQTVTVHRPDLSIFVPTANAGSDQTGTAGTTVTLDGTGSTDYDQPVAPLLNYAWSQVSGPGAALSNLFVAQPTFTPVVPGIYVFSLDVDDGAITSAIDLVTVTVNSPADHVPVANAGDDGVGSTYLTYILDGSASIDSDASILTYAWTQTRGDRTPLSDVTTSTPSFTPISAGLYEFELIVNDGAMDSNSDRVSIVIERDASGENRIPVANAGVDQVPTATNPTNYAIIDSGTGQVVIGLDGSNSYDGDSDPLTYIWRQTRGTSSTLSTNNLPTASITTLTVKVPGIYEFELIVTDGKNYSNRDRVQVAVASSSNLPPLANAGADQHIILNGVPSAVYLNGTGSSDPEGVPLTFLWNQTGGPSVTLSSNNSPTPSFIANVAGVYTFALEVQDGQTPPIPGYDTVTVTVASIGDGIPQANAGADQSSIYVDTLVTLDGSGSYDVDGDPLTYFWTQISGTAIVLSNRYVANPTFIPRVRSAYAFRLEVTDDDNNKDNDTSTVHVIGGDTGTGGGTTDPPLGGGTVSGGGGGGCSINPGSKKIDPAFFLPLLILLGFALIRRSQAGRAQFNMTN